MRERSPSPNSKPSLENNPPMRPTNPYIPHWSDSSWLIEEKGWDQKLQGERETLFTTGNGFMSMRGILEEVPYDASAGTFIGGIYDQTGAQITELVNLPNPLAFRLSIGGEKLDPVATSVVHHERTLDMQTGTLYRHTIYRLAGK